jgi:Zn-dependent protease with chaperone function
MSLQLGMKALEEERYSDAAELLEGFCRNYAGDRSKECLQAKMSLVKAYRYTKRIDEAIAICQELAEDPSRKIQAWAENALQALEPERSQAMSQAGSEDLSSPPTEIEIAAALEQYLAGYNLNIQVTQQEHQLLIILNRPAEISLDYSHIVAEITSHVRDLQLTDISYLLIYSRVLGEFEPDWQTQVDLQSTESDREVGLLEVEVEAHNTEEPEEIAEITDHEFASDLEFVDQIAGSEAIASNYESDLENDYEVDEQPTTAKKAGMGHDWEDDLLGDTSLNNLEQLLANDLDADLAENQPEIDSPSSFSPDSSEFDSLDLESQEAEAATEDSENFDAFVSESSSDQAVINDDGELDLSAYCFARNTHLVKTSLPNPDIAVAQAVLFFHLLDDSDRKLIMPTLVEFFKAPKKTSLDGLPEEIKQWLTDILSLSDLEFRSVSVWLSRYCADADAALTQIDATLSAAAEVANAEQETAEANSSPRNSRARAANNSGKSTPPTSQSFAKAGRSKVLGATLAIAKNAGKLSLASGVTISLLFGMVLVLSLAVLLIVGNQNPGAGLAIAIVITLVVNAALFFLSPLIMDLTQAWLYGTRWVKLTEIERYSPEAAQVIKRVCNQKKITTPRLGIIDDQNPTAFTYGALPNSARLVVSKGLFTYLDDEEVATVYAHELGHIVHWDFAVMTLASTLVQITYLIYIFAREFGDKFGDKAKNAARSASMLAYVFYVAGTFMLLYLSRTREYFADHFAAEVTGNPNALSRALVKIAYGILEENKNTKTPSRLIEGTRALGIYDAKAAATTGTAYQIATEPQKIGLVFLWDLFNPWGWWMELGSTHPLTGKRVRALSNYAEQLGLDVEYDMASVVAEGKRLSKSRLYKSFALDLCLSWAEWIGVIFGLFAASLIVSILGSDWWRAWLALPLTLFGVGVLIKTQISFPGANRSVQTDILTLMCDPYASPLRGQPVKLEGEIIGRGDAGYIFGSDLKLQDSTGMIFLRYASRFGPLGNFLFGASQVKELIGHESKVTGWFRRGIMPWVDLNRVISESGKKVDSYPTFWSVVIGFTSILVGIFIIPKLFT